MVGTSTQAVILCMLLLSEMKIKCENDGNTNETKTNFRNCVYDKQYIPVRGSTVFQTESYPISFYLGETLKVKVDTIFLNKNASYRVYCVLGIGSLKLFNCKGF